MAGIFDLMAGLGDMGAIVEKNKDMLESLPATLDNWSRLQIEMAQLTRAIRDTQAEHSALLAQILSACQGDAYLPPDVAMKAIAFSYNDPRNGASENA